MNIEQRIARHVRQIPRSGIRDFFEVVQGMPDVISLGIGEPDFVTPWHIREAAIYALERGRTSYTSNLGLPKLRQTIARYVEKAHGVVYDPRSEVLVSVGVSEALDLALRALVDPGDEVIYHEPCYVSYLPSIELAHGVGVAIRTKEEDGFILRAEALESAITPRTKAVLLCFPTNPTGATLPREELERIAKVCVERDLLVLTDEIYSELTYEQGGHRSIVSLQGMRERTIFLHGVSKAYAMTGFRIGFACAPVGLIEAMMKVHQYGILCAPIVSQDAAIEALENGSDAMEVMREDYRARRDFVVGALNKMGLPCRVPGGAFYVFPRISPLGMSSREFALGLLESKKVAAVPGSAFGVGGEGYIRCSYATSFENLRRAMDRMGEFVQERQNSDPGTTREARASDAA
ncbi:MAG: aminotransferase class I/II-fold pyridoxal phosphate-dependent enzyme [Verrucomicrobiia bacterium]